jgi:cytoskeletal protein CcmA (bactofilin family)
LELGFLSPNFIFKFYLIFNHMKKNLFSVVIILISIISVKAQNTIPTTTVTGALSVNDSLNVTRHITANGNVTSKGEIIARDTMRAQKDVIVDGNVTVGGKLKVDGNSIFKGWIRAKNGFMFDNNTGITYTPSAGSSAKLFQYGNKVAGIPGACGAAPQVWANHQFGGMLQIFDADPITGAYITNSGLLNIQTWSGGSSIDASIGGLSNNAGLLLNYFCGNDVSICQGTYGGYVGMGKNVEIGFPTRNAQTLLNMSLPSGTTKAVTITNPAVATSNKIVFEITNTGKTQIGLGKPKVGGIAANAMLSVDGLILAKEVRVAVSTTTHWADYVFNKEYKLMPLNEVEKYIKKNNHLPDVPSANDVKENGIDMLQMNATLLKKIEELTLYTIELKKQIDAQQIEINEIKK